MTVPNGEPGHGERERVSLPLLHRVLQTRFRRARLERLLLALVRRPGGEPDDVEGGADAAVRVGEALGIDLCHLEKRGAAGRPAAALEEEVGRAHPPQIVHQGKGVVIAHHNAVDIGHRKCKPGPLQQRADIAQIRKRRHARRDTALAFGLGRRERLPQLGERIAADHGREQQPIRLQRAADLREHAGQIVDKLEGERRQHQIKRGIRKREPLRPGLR